MHRFIADDRRVIPGLVLVVLVLLAAASSRGGLPMAGGLAAVSVLWLAVNKSIEGPVLWTVTAHHGITASDLAGLTGLAIAVWRASQVWRRSGSSEAEGGR